MLVDDREFGYKESNLRLYGQPDPRSFARGQTFQIADTEDRQRATVQRIRKLTGKDGCGSDLIHAAYRK